MRRALEDAVGRLKVGRLFIMVDELLDRLFSKAHRGEITRELFRDLWGVVTAVPNVRWLFIVKDGYFYDTKSLIMAGPLLQRSVDVSLQHFDRQWAEKLVREPAHSIGVTYEPATLITEMVTLTAGNPFFLQILCLRLIDRVQESHHTIITSEDVAHVVQLTLRDGKRYFAHLLEDLSERAWLVLATVAELTQEGEGVERAKIAATLRGYKLSLRQRDLAPAFKALHRAGVLAESMCAGAPWVHITIPLFHQWIKCYEPLEHAVAMWCQAGAEASAR